MAMAQAQGRPVQILKRGNIFFQLKKWGSENFAKGGGEVPQVLQWRAAPAQAHLALKSLARGVPCKISWRGKIWGSKFFFDSAPASEASAVWVGAKQGVQGAVAPWRGSGGGAPRKILKIRSSKTVGKSIYNTLCQKTSNWSRKPLHCD